MLPVFKKLIFLSGRLKPEAVFLRYVKLAREQGLNKPYFVLSMDCDTELDIDVVMQVHLKLKAMGIQPVYAVCGEMLERGSKIYKEISDMGSEFINHGYRIHTKFNASNKTYEGTVFYDKLSKDDIVADIKEGHDAVLSILGKAPIGFRTPHFGTFQSEEQMMLIHETIKPLGYAYSSSAMPLSGLVNGPLYKSKYGIYELAVSGWFDKPDLILDSWGFRYDPCRKVCEDDYISQFGKMVDFFYKGNRPGLLNYYVDPSQVCDWEPFFECMKLTAPIAAASYKCLLDKVYAK